MPTDAATLASDKQATLNFANQLRSERGQGPLTELPKGRRGTVNCPVANVLTGMLPHTPGIEPVRRLADQDATTSERHDEIIENRWEADQ